MCIKLILRKYYVFMLFFICVRKTYEELCVSIRTVLLINKNVILYENKKNSSIYK